MSEKEIWRDFISSTRELYHRIPLAKLVLSGPVALRRALYNRENSADSVIRERLGTIICEDVVIDVPEFEGRFRCSPTSHLFHRLIANGSYEHAISSLFKSYINPEKDVLDIGANIGFYSVLAAKHLSTGRVLAVEPTNGAHARLVENLRRNAVVDKVVIYKGLVTDRNGETEFSQIEGMEEYSSLAGNVHASVSDIACSSVLAPTRRIDDLVAEYGLRPGLIKIDVEGAESLAFRGASETLREYRPIVISEISDRLLKAMGSSSSELIALFNGLNYDVIDPRTPSRRIGEHEGDILCLPR